MLRRIIFLISTEVFKYALFKYLFRSYLVIMCFYFVFVPFLWFYRKSILMLVDDIRFNYVRLSEVKLGTKRLG